MELKLDFRLLEVSLELQALEEHFNLLEKQILIVSNEEKKLLEEKRRKEKFTPEDPEWDFSTQVYERKVEFLLPRFFWGPFIVSL